MTDARTSEPVNWATLLTNERVLAMAGPETFARAAVYAREGRVSQVSANHTLLLIVGRVAGSVRDSYQTSVQLSASGTHRGLCSCPVALDCKHAAALLIAARTDLSASLLNPAPEWETALDRLLGGTGTAPVTELVPLGLEFEVHRTPAYRGHVGRYQLQMRPVQRGKSGRWIKTGISWDELDYPSRNHDPDQRNVLLQLRAAAGSVGHFGYPKSTWLALSTVSPGWWPLLERSVATGLALLTTTSVAARPVRILAEPVEASFDLRRTPAGLSLAPRLTSGPELLKVPQVGLIGDPAHGLFYQTEDDRGRPGPLVLAPLVEPMAAELCQVVLDIKPIVVPEEDRQRFLAEYLPTLRRRVAVVSTDSSVSLPESAAPRLTLQCVAETEHRLRLAWGVGYVSSGLDQQFSLDDPPAPKTVRDPLAEQQLVASLPIPYHRLPQLGSTVRGRRTLSPRAVLAEADLVLFVVEVLPELQRCGVDVTVTGELLDYRVSGSPPLIEVSTTDPDPRSDWFDLHVKVSLDGESVPFEELFVALTTGEELLILETGVCLSLDRPELRQLLDLIAEARSLQDQVSPQLRLNSYQVGIWEELTRLGVVVEQSERWARSVRGLLDESSEPGPDPPDTLQATLRPYQLEGFRWLSSLWAAGMGGILADDMGLGKTVQALALICHARAQSPGLPPFLVVAPTSVVSNWESEVHRFAPGQRVVVVTQSEAKRGRTLADLATSADIVVTSYALLRIDIDSYQQCSWAGVILDEAQFVKNHQAKTYQCTRRLMSPFKLAITGTPLENSLMDLWALLSITAPGLFPHPDRFAEQYRRPIERDRDTARLRRLQQRIRPLMLRRTKEQVAAELPPKQEQLLEVTLHPKHQRVYQTHLQRERQKILGLIDDLDSNRFTILRSLTLLRQLSLDVSLVDARHLEVPASKIDVLLEHLVEVTAEGHQALVFSQFTKFLSRIKPRLEERGISYAYLDGATRNRAEAISDFRAGGSQVFLISLKAGGFGINLTEADYVFVMDPWWNPAAETQAVDRAHRMGQTKTVMVYRLVAQGTIEEKVMQLKARKSDLFESVLGGETVAGGSLSAQEIKELIDV